MFAPFWPLQGTASEGRRARREIPVGLETIPECGYADAVVLRVPEERLCSFWDLESYHSGGRAITLHGQIQGDPADSG